MNEIKELDKKSTERITKEYSWEKIVDEYEKVLGWYNETRRLNFNYSPNI